MNELIDDIAFQAGCNKHLYHDPKHSDLDGFIISQEILDKFAKLIIQECVKVAKRTGSLNESDFEGEMIADAIKEHFGIKE